MSNKGIIIGSIVFAGGVILLATQKAGAQPPPAGYGSVAFPVTPVNFANSVSLSIDSQAVNGPFPITVNLTPGAHTWQASATDGESLSGSLTIVAGHTYTQILAFHPIQPPAEEPYP